MRSRYTAFSLGNEDHLFRTWHPKTRPSDIGLDAETTWLGLKILDTTEGMESDDTGTVHFTAKYRDHLGEHMLEENSSFVRRAKKWVYLDAIDD